MKSLTAIIVDDEIDSVELLTLLLKKHCPSISSIAVFTNSTEAYNYLSEFSSPDVLFLDIDMPGLNGFDLLNKLSPRRFNTIFITSHNQYAVQAFRMNALDYLLKPAEPLQLREAVNRIHEKELPDSVQLLQLQKMLNGNQPDIFALPTQSGVIFLKLADIILLEAISNYVKFYLTGNKSVTAAKNLKELQDLFEHYHFMRVHRSFIVNLKRVKKFLQTDNILVMENDIEIPVARPQRQKLKGYFTWL